MANPRIEELRKRLEKEPGSRLFAQLAEELRKEGDLEDAIRVCREGLQKHPAYPSARMTLGRALMDTGDLVAARAEFETVIKGAPDNILASRFLGECLEGLGETGAAIARFKATLALAPGDKQVQARLAELEARAAAPPAVAPVEAPSVEGEPEAVVEAEPPPIPLAQVEEESFELERPYEAQTPAVETRPVEAIAFEEEAATMPAVISPRAEAAPSGAEALPGAEPPPVPLVAAPEGFELEERFEAPAPRQEPVPAPPAAAEAPPGGEEAADTFEFVMPEPAPPPVALPTPQPAPEPTPAPPIASPTLAELYFNQGHTDKAIEVYRQILEREPGNGRVEARLAELEALERHLKAQESQGARGPVPTARPAPDTRQARRAALERTIGRLEGFLAAVRKG